MGQFGDPVIEFVVAQSSGIVAHLPHSIYFYIALEKIEIRCSLAEVARIEQQHAVVFVPNLVDQVGTLGVPAIPRPFALVVRDGEYLAVRIVGMQYRDGLLPVAESSFENGDTGSHHYHGGYRKLDDPT